MWENFWQELPTCLSLRELIKDQTFVIRKLEGLTANICQSNTKLIADGLSAHLGPKLEQHTQITWHAQVIWYLHDICMTRSDYRLLVSQTCHLNVSIWFGVFLVTTAGQMVYPLKLGALNIWLNLLLLCINSLYLCLISFIYWLIRVVAKTHVPTRLVAPCRQIRFPFIDIKQNIFLWDAREGYRWGGMQGENVAYGRHWISWCHPLVILHCSCQESRPHILYLTISPLSTIQHLIVRMK